MAREIALEALIDAIDNIGLEYMVVGSLSSNVYGGRHATQDYDLVIENNDRIADLSKSLESADWRMRPVKRFATNYNLFHADSGFEATLFCLTDDEHDRERFLRRLVIDLHNRDISIPTAEDVIVQKLRWARAKDRQDVRDILDVQGDALDFDYIHHWCDQHDSLTTLQEIQAMPFE